MNDDMVAEEKVLSEYSRAAERPEGTRLEEWVKRYPQHEKALVEFATFDYVFERGVQYHANVQELESLFLSRAETVRQSLRAAGPSPTRPPLRSLLAAAREARLDPAALAARLGIGSTLLAKLERRLIRAGTVPREMLTQLGAAVGRSADEIATYLGAPATLSAQASYRAAAAPSLKMYARRVAESRGPSGDTFADAVRASRDMTEEQKAHWLAAASTPSAEE